MARDTYEGFAERYDWMVSEDSVRRKFFQQLFADHGVKKVLDCACGTGHDLIMLHSIGCDVFASDLSESMLAQTRKNLSAAGIDVPLVRADFRHLPDYFDMKFDAVVCLTNSINEVLKDEETLQALHSMKSVLRDGGILVFDQGQTDATMKNQPKFDAVVNNRDWTRFFVLEYFGDVMTVNVFDFIHTETTSDFKHSKVHVRIRLQDSWTRLLHDAGFSIVRFLENWDCAPYNKETSWRLIAVATI
jgi:ubiquinone/menaquinone biosynthesis C-methylase UbiE